MINVEGFFSSIKNALGIPIGVSYRKSYGMEGGSIERNTIFDNPYAEVICDITADDVCRGEEPVSYSTELPEGVDKLPDNVLSTLESFKKELNSIARWVSKDLQVNGVSVYDATYNKEDSTIVLMPNLNNLEFYLTKDKRVIAYDLEDVNKKNLENAIIFINYDKNSLVKIDEKNKDLSKDVVFSIKPTPMQFKNTQSTLDSINLQENCIKRYMAQRSRIVRFATVDIGLSNGDVQKDVVESISSAINADSMNLTSTTNEEYNDNIPIIPTRNGKGAPNLVMEAPDGDVKDLSEIKYFLDKLNLLTRFPATYMDFTQNMGSTAVSMIRSDLRYAKLCNSIRTLIEKTINDFIEQTESLKEYNVVYSLIQLPTSEDDDVIQNMSNYTELASEIYNFVMGDNEEESVDLKVQRLDMIQGLFNTSVKSPIIQNWFDGFSEFIEELRSGMNKNNEDEEGLEEDSSNRLGFGGGGMGGGLSDLGNPDYTSEDLNDEVGGEAEAGDIETFEPQTEDI